MTIETAVAFALAGDPGVRAARHRVSAAYWRRVAAARPANPELVVSADPTEWTARLAAHIADVLDAGGRRRVRGDIARADEEEALLDVERRRIAVARAVRSDFAEAVARRRGSAVAHDRVEAHEMMVELARAEHRAGEVSALDLADVGRPAIEARQVARELVRQAGLAEARLNRRLGRPPSTPLNLAPPDEDAAWVVADPFAPDLELDLGRRPEPAVLAARMAGHRARLGTARMQWLDGLEAGPYLVREGGSSRTGAEVSLRLPVFDRGGATRGEQAAVLAALEEELLSVQAGMVLEVQDALARLREADVWLRADLAEMREMAEARYVLVGQAGRLGETSGRDALAARLDLLALDLEREAARLAWWQAQADLAAVLGDAGEPAGDGHDHGEP